MTDPHSDPQYEGMQDPRTRDNGGRSSHRGGRGQGNRDQGGFRIRLSDNEMRSARALQDAFNLRSTVAVLGFALRTLGQMLEEGKLDELIKEYRSQNPRRDGRQRDSRGSRFDGGDKTNSSRGAVERPNPFARPPKPEPVEEKDSESTSGDIKSEEEPNQNDNSQEAATTNEESSSEKSQEV